MPKRTEHFSCLSPSIYLEGMVTADPKETRLVIKAQTGDKIAFDELLQRVQAPLSRYIFNLVWDQSLAEDVLQSVFWTIYKKIGWLNEPEVFRPWAYRIASRECIRQMKKEKRWNDQIRDEELLKNLRSAEVPDEDHDLVLDIPRVLSSVSPASRAVLVLHYIEEMSLAETAEILDISIGTVKSRLAYGLARLREQMT